MKFLFLGLTFLSFTAFADNYVTPYTQLDGTNVQGHYRTDPNSTRNDNYSTRENVNPYTGEIGSKPRDNEVQQQQYSPYNQRNFYDSNFNTRGR